MVFIFLICPLILIPGGNNLQTVMQENSTSSICGKGDPRSDQGLYCPRGVDNTLKF